MEIAAVYGSPRPKGNSQALADFFLQAAQASGGRVRRYRLNAMHYKGCQACNACKKDHAKCVLKDGLTPLLDGIPHVDVLVVATPVYFGDVSGQTKLFIDRCYSFFKPDYYTLKRASRLSAGKKLVLVLSQRVDERAFDDIAVRYNRVFQRFGFDPIYLIRGCELGDSTTAAAQRKDLIAQAQQTARRVLSGKPPAVEIPLVELPGDLRIAP